MKYTYLILSLIVISGAALAVSSPGIPQPFFGSVTINGATAPNGAVVSARISGVEIATTTTVGGQYGDSSSFLVPDSDNNNRAGTTINFFVNGIDSGASYPFTNGLPTRINLGITQQTSPPSGGNGGGGGGGGGSPSSSSSNSSSQQSSSSSPTLAATTQPGNGTCTERWLCTDWSWCVNGINTRTCEDVNKCGTDLYRPMESQPCGAEEANSPVSSLISGMAVFGDPTIMGGVIVILVIVVFVLWKLFSRKNKKIAPQA